METLNNQPKTELEKKKNSIHKNLLIVFTTVGIISFTLGALVNYHTLKRLK